MKKAIIRMTEFSVQNNRFERLEHINMVFRQGESYLLWGRDHTGRTFADIFCGNVRSYAGEIYVHDKQIDVCREESFISEKVFYIDTRTDFIKALDLAENMFILKKNHLRKVVLNQRALHFQAREILQKYGFDFDVWGSADNLSEVEKVFLNIIRAADQGARMIVLSNITSICGPRDSHRLIILLQQLREEGITLFIYDSNPTRFLEITDTILLVHGGRIEKKIFDRRQFYMCDAIMAARVRQNKKKESKPDNAAEENKYMITGAGDDININITVKPGEIVYLAAAHGYQQEQVWKILGGEASSPIMIGRGQSQKQYKSRSALMNDRIAFWGERDIDSELFKNMSVKDNIFLPSVKKISKFGFYKPGERFIVQDKEFFEDFKWMGEKRVYKDEHIRKMVFYRWKLFHPRILIMNNVLSRADREMKEWLLEHLVVLAERKTAIILLETAHDDAIEIADSVVVIKDRGSEGHDEKQKK